MRVLTAGDANDVHDYHNRALLAQKVVASVTDGEGTVAATDIDGTMFVFVVGASRVYSYPSIVGTSRSEKPVVTLGEYLPVVSTFDACSRRT